MEKTKKVTVSLTDEEFIKIAKMAHERNITFNAMCNKIIEDKIEETKRISRESTSPIKCCSRTIKKTTSKRRTRSVSEV